MITEPTPTSITEEQEAATLPTTAPSPTLQYASRQPAFRTPRPALAWLLVPLMAVAAYAPTLGIWFLSDDFGHLLFHQSLPFPKALIAFDVSMFYRPLSTVLTWNLGYVLFGTNALPYHIVSLLCHALASLFLGRAVAVIAANKRIGWLAGAIFAVYPLCTEPVAWLASQWDVLGAVCITGAVWAFAVAWRTQSRLAYSISLVATFLAVMMKESTLPFPLVMPFVALATELSPHVAGASSPNMSRMEWLALARCAFVWSLPFFVPSLLFVGLRLYAAGTVGGYANAATDYQHFFWDAIVTASLEALMPLNRLVFSQLVTQLVGALITGFFLLGLILWGRRRWPLLLLGLVWWLAFVLPVLNLLPPTVNNPTLQNNRILYLSMMGFAIVLATLIASFLEEHWARRIGKPAVALALLAAIPVTWVQLQPWLAASNQTRHILNELQSLVPHMSREWIDINVTHLPGDYEGAYVFRNGLDYGMINFNDQLTRIFPVERLRPQELANPFKGANGRFSLDFDFNPKSKIFYVSSLAGVTGVVPQPENPTRLWDFRQCGDKMPDGWQVANAATQCAGNYVAVNPTGSDPNLLFSNLDIDLTGKSWVRLGVYARYPVFTDDRIAEWFWQTDSDTTWSEDHAHNYYLDATNTRLAYWTYLRVDDIGKRLNSLRLDPVNGDLTTQLFWISLDLK